jgi:hypothetical protein
MHLMHLIWVFGHLIGYFHNPSVIVTWTMVVAGFLLIFVFFKVFEHDLFDRSDDD